MTRRSILTITQRDGKLAASVHQSEPPLPPDWDERVSFGYDATELPQLTTDALLAQYGDKLAQGLLQHQAIAQVLQRAFNATPADVHTVGLTVRADQGRQIRWEALRDPQGRFVALDGLCHIGRTVRRLAGAPQAAREFVPPLRILAFLSAAGLDARQEWEALSTAIEAARDKGLLVEADVRIGQDDLRTDAEFHAALLSKKHDGAIRVGSLPASAPALEVAIRDARPHILHFFCHGQAAMGASFLELATTVDHLQGRPGSVHVSIDTLTRLPELRDVWLVVLNCCEGAMAGTDIDSMAERMVEGAGLGAAIGMLEPITVGEANRFCAALYPELFHVLDDVLKMQPGGGTRFVNLTPAMSRARRELRDLNPPLRPGPRWTLPVLFQCEEPVQVYRGGAPAPQTAAAPPQGALPPQPAPVGPTADSTTFRSRVEAIAGMLAALPPSTPESVREGMLALLDEAPIVPTALRPDRLGRFGANDDPAGGGGH
jgi:hypothetical protein